MTGHVSKDYRDAVNDWNQRYPVGTEVTAYARLGSEGIETSTLSLAGVRPGERPGVYVADMRYPSWAQMAVRWPLALVSPRVTAEARAAEWMRADEEGRWARRDRTAPVGRER